MYPSGDRTGWIVNIAPDDDLELTPGTWSQPRKRTGSYRDKQHKCLYPGCFKAFYHKHHLRRHETAAHGRTPVPANKTKNDQGLMFHSSMKEGALSHLDTWVP